MTTPPTKQLMQKPKIQRTTGMKQIFLYTSLAVMALAVTTTGAAPERCDGTVQLTSQSNFQVRQAGTQTFVQFDFTGLHDICLADHSVVTGIVEGHLVQRHARVSWRGQPHRGQLAEQRDDGGPRHRPASGNPRAGDVCVHRPHIAGRRHLLCVHALTRRVATRNLCLSGAVGKNSGHG
jgi:hypothetical protein